jgi:hypothetical protein
LKEHLQHYTMADAARRELKGSESPGGTKTFDLDLTLVQSRGSSGNFFEGFKTEHMTAANDNMIDLATRTAGTTNQDVTGILEMRERFEKAQLKEVPSGLQSPSALLGVETFDGSFSWDNFGQIKDLSEANSSLLQQLDKKEEELKNLQAQITSNAQITGYDPCVLKGLKDADGNFVNVADRFKDAKIAQLVKKTRNLNLLLEKEKKNASTLAKEIERLQVDEKEDMLSVQTKHFSSETSDAQHLATALSNAEIEIRKNRKRMEHLRITRDKAHEDMRRLTTALRREVGDSVDIEAVLNGHLPDGGVRGRSQQIVILKSKCKRLENEISRLQQRELENKYVGGHDTFCDDSNRRKGFNVDERASKRIEKINREKQESSETVVRELNEMRQIAILQKEKLDGQKARLGTLQKENKKMRGEMKILLSKTGTDDKLIDALRDEVAQSRAAINEMSRRLESIKMHGGMNEAEWMQLKSSKRTQQIQIDRQEELITTLRAEVDQLQSNASADLVERAEQEMSIHNKNADINLLRIENERVTEMAEMFKNKFQAETMKNVAAGSKIRHLETQAIALERRLGNIYSGGLKRQPPADQFQQLKDKLALQIEENLALKKSFRTGLATKDEELRILRTLTEQQQVAYERALQEMKRQVKQTAGQAQAKVIQTDSKSGSKLLVHLKADNDYLRKELHAMQSKLRDAEASKRVRPMANAHK